MNIHAKYLTKNKETNQQHIKRIMHPDKWGLSQESKFALITENQLLLIHHKNKNMIISVSEDKEFEKIQRPLMPKFSGNYE